MSTDLDLKQTEKESLKLAAYADGTSDISLGLVFILLGFYPLTRAALGPVLNMFVFLAGLAAIVISLQVLRKRITPSRIGIVEFGENIRRLKGVALLITIFLAAMMILTWVLSARGWSPAFPGWMRSYGVDILITLIVLAIFWTVAYAIHMRRYYLYGVLLAAGFPVQAILSGVYGGAAFIAAGLIITAIGVALLVRFLKQYPELDEGAAND